MTYIISYKTGAPCHQVVKNVDYIEIQDACVILHTTNGDFTYGLDEVVKLVKIPSK